MKVYLLKDADFDCLAHLLEFERLRRSEPLPLPEIAEVTVSAAGHTPRPANVVRTVHSWFSAAVSRWVEEVKRG